MTGDSLIRELGRRFRDRPAWELVILTAAALSWLYLLIITSGQLLRITAWSVPFLLMIALVSLPWRSISWKHLAGFFMLGMGPVFLLAAASQWALGALPLEDWVRSGLESLASTGFNLRINDPGKHLWAPITEELWKVTPLLIFIWWRRTGLRSLASPIDYAVLAGATGAGMAFSEDILVFLHLGLDGPPSSSFALGLGQFYRELIGAEPGLFILEGRSDFADNMSFFFPEMQEQNGVVWSGHGALALGLGLSIGLAVWAVRRRQNRLFYLIPVVVYFWVVWEHLMTNWYGGAACFAQDSPLCTVANLDLRGRIFSLAVLAAFVYAAYLSREAIIALRKADPALSVGRAEVDRATYRTKGWRGSIALLRDQLDFWRWRRKTAYGVSHLRHGREVRQYQVLALLTCRTQTLLLRERLTGQPPTVIPDDAKDLMARIPILS